jgi:sodium pump decarboxylase gamma subunit
MNVLLSYLSESAEQGVIDRLLSYTETESQSVAQQQLADPDYWGSVGIIALSGILVVFMILAILIFVFWLMGKIFTTAGKKKSEEQKAPAAAPVQAAPVEEAAVEDEDVDDDEEIMAVISAAIAAYSEQDGKDYTIRSVKRRGRRTRSAWSLAGIGENTRPF